MFSTLHLPPTCLFVSPRSCVRHCWFDICVSTVVCCMDTRVGALCAMDLVSVVVVLCDVA